MMNLVIDQGNSRCKVAVYQHDEMLKFHVSKSPDKDLFLSVLEEFSEIQSCIYCSVMDNSPRYLGFLKKKMNYFMEMDPGLQFPFRIAYQTPETLGKDRLAAIVGAYTKFPKQNVLVIDAGSAVTYDILTDQEEYLGGNISPGLEMRYKALHQFTGRLPLVTPEITGNTYGRTTREAINEGVLQGMLYEVEGYIARWQKIYEDLKIILTGGDANFFEKKLKNGIFVNLNLVTNGLNTILNINVQK